MTTSAALYEVQIQHVRAEPVRHEIRHSSYQWFVDLDDLPRLPRPLRALARFQARDHLGDPARTLRENVDSYLGDNGIDLRGGQITMLANARSLGYVFNPLSLYWCHDPAGQLVCVVAEVHNTYGERHRYLLHTDDAGRAYTDKQFYVSPFYPVDGYYRMSVPEPGQHLALTVTLHRPGQRPFTASVRGVHRPATLRTVLAVALRHPAETWRVRALITKHGIALWRKGLPVVTRTNWHPRRRQPRLGCPAGCQARADLLQAGVAARYAPARRGLRLGGADQLRRRAFRCAGAQQYPAYAATLRGVLKPTGRLLLQQMSRRHDAGPGGGAFIEAYIAPDMHMRPLSQTIGYLERAGFEVRDVEAMREHSVIDTVWGLLFAAAAVAVFVGSAGHGYWGSFSSRPSTGRAA